MSFDCAWSLHSSSFKKRKALLDWSRTHQAITAGGLAKVLGMGLPKPGSRAHSRNCVNARFRVPCGLQNSRRLQAPKGFDQRSSTESFRIDVDLAWLFDHRHKRLFDAVRSAFLWKIALISWGLSNAILLHSRDGLARADRWSKLQAALSILIWIGTVTCGRWIAYV
jgi:hypothetical protein